MSTTKVLQIWWRETETVQEVSLTTLYRFGRVWIYLWSGAKAGFEEEVLQILGSSNSQKKGASRKLLCSQLGKYQEMLMASFEILDHSKVIEAMNQWMFLMKLTTRFLLFVMGTRRYGCRVWITCDYRIHIGCCCLSVLLLPYYRIYIFSWWLKIHYRMLYFTGCGCLSNRSSLLSYSTNFLNLHSGAVGFFSAPVVLQHSDKRRVVFC
jgi:hypothetical protein